LVDVQRECHPLSIRVCEGFARDGLDEGWRHEYLLAPRFSGFRSRGSDREELLFRGWHVPMLRHPPGPRNPGSKRNPLSSRHSGSIRSHTLGGHSGGFGKQGRVCHRSHGKGWHDGYRLQCQLRRRPSCKTRRRLVGNLDLGAIKEKIRRLRQSPAKFGRMTVTMPLVNTVTAAQRRVAAQSSEKLRNSMKSLDFFIDLKYN